MISGVALEHLSKLLEADEEKKNMQEAQMSPEIEYIAKGLEEQNRTPEDVESIISVIQQAENFADQDMESTIDGMTGGDEMSGDDAGIASLLDSNAGMEENPLDDGVIDEKDVVRDEEEYHDRQEGMEMDQNLGINSEEETTADQEMNTEEHMKDEDVLMALIENGEDKEEDEDEDEEDEKE